MSELSSVPPEEALAFCLDQFMVDKVPMEACVERFPEHRTELLELLPLARLLQHAGEIAPRPAYREQAASRLEARLAQSKRPPVYSPNGPGAFAGLNGDLAATIRQLFLAPSRRYAVVAMLAVLLLVVSGLFGVTTVDAAVPGDALYGADLALEGARLRLVGSEQRRTELRVLFAGERLAEAQQLVDAGDSDNLQVALLAYAELVEAIAASTAAEALDGARAEQLNRVMAGQQTQLDILFRTSDGTTAAFCDQAGQHPLAASLAAQYDLPYGVIVDRLCDGVSYGQLALALATAHQQDIPAETILSLLASSAGWGEVWQRLSSETFPTPGRGESEPPLGSEPTGGPGNATVEEPAATATAKSTPAGNRQEPDPPAAVPGQPPRPVTPPGLDDSADPPAANPGQPPRPVTPPGQDESANPPATNPGQPPAPATPPGQDNTPGPPAVDPGPEPPVDLPPPASGEHPAPTPASPPEEEHPVVPTPPANPPNPYPPPTETAEPTYPYPAPPEAVEEDAVDDSTDDDAAAAYFCGAPAFNHPLAARLADKHGVAYEEVIGLYCEGYGLGEIAIALSVASASGETPAELLASRDDEGWGQIWQNLDRPGRPDDTGPPDHAGPPDDEQPGNGGGPPDHAGPPDNDDQPGNGNGPPDHAGPPDDDEQPGNGNGPPDHAGPPDDEQPGNGGGPPDEHPGNSDGPPDHAGPPDGRDGGE